MSKRLTIDSELAPLTGDAMFQDWSWPVAQSQYDTPITNFIEWTDRLHEQIGNSEQLLAAFYISKPGLLKDLSYISTALLDVTLASQCGYEPVFNDDKYLYKMVVEDSYPRIVPTEILSTPHPVGIRSKLRNRIARSVRIRSFSRQIQIASTNFSIGPNQLTSELTPPDTQALRRTHDDVLRARPNINIPSEATGLSQVISKRFIDEIESVVGSTSKNLASYIEWLVQKYLTTGWQDINARDHVAKRTANSNLFTGTGGGLAARLTSYQFLRAGHTVIRTTHGGDSPLFEDVLWPTTEFPFASTYVAYGESGASSLTETIANRLESTTPHYVNGVVASGSKSHSAIYNSSRNVQPRSAQNVTVIAGSFTGMTPVMPHMKFHDLVYLEWHRRLLASISKHGYSVTSKRHPKGSLTDRHLFDGIVDHELIETPMSAVQKTTDVYVVDFPASAFMEALCTLKPVVLIDTGVRRMKPAARIELMKSVEFVEATFDENNRITIDDSLLRSAIESPVDVEAREQLINDYLLRPTDNFQSIYS
jgi:hypothetical protein